MPKGRPEKDSIDIISLILDRVQEISVNDVVKKCRQAGLIDHILSQMQDFAKAVTVGEMGKDMVAGDRHCSHGRSGKKCPEVSAGA